MKNTKNELYYDGDYDGYGYDNSGKKFREFEPKKPSKIIKLIKWLLFIAILVFLSYEGMGFYENYMQNKDHLVSDKTSVLIQHQNVYQTAYKAGI